MLVAFMVAYVLQVSLVVALVLRLLVGVAKFVSCCLGDSGTYCLWSGVGGVVATHKCERLLLAALGLEVWCEGCCSVALLRPGKTGCRTGPIPVRSVIAPSRSGLGMWLAEG